MKNFIYLLLLIPLFALAQAEPATESGLNAIETSIEASNVLLTDIRTNIEANNVLLTNIEANTSNDGLRAFYIGSTVGLGSNCRTLVLAESGTVILARQSSSGAPQVFWLSLTAINSSTSFQILPVRETLLEAKEDLLAIFNKENETSFILPIDCSELNAALLSL